MILVSVRPRLAQARGAGAAKDPSELCVELGELQVAVRTGAVLGFSQQVAGRIVVGESCFPMDEAQTRRLDEALRADVPLDVLIGDRFLLLLVIDPQARTATVASSIAASRFYYLSTGPNAFTLSSSVRGLREAGCELAWNPECTPEFLTYLSVSPPRSILRGIHKIAAGQRLTVNLADGAIREDGRWRWPEPNGGEDDVDVIAALRSHIREWLASYPRVGVLLSGGVDSSLLAALARVDQPDIPTFSTSFSFIDRDDAETSYATSMARQLGVSHEAHPVTAERYLAGWVESLHACEEPVRHLQSVLLHLLFRNGGAAGCEAILCGEAGDYVFGNATHSFLHRYRRHIAVLRATRVASLLAPLVEALPWRRRWATLLTRQYHGRIGSRHHFLWTIGRRCDPGLVRRLVPCDATAPLGERTALLAPYRDRTAFDHVTAAGMLFAGHQTRTVWGKLAEASGIRLAFPYQSPSVFVAAATVPWDIKLRESKHLARVALRELGVPEALVSRPKLSFGLPTRFWALPGTLFQPVVDMAKPAYGSAVLESLQRTDSASSMALWGLLNQYLWRQLFELSRSVDDLAGEIVDRHRKAGGPTRVLATAPS